MIINTYIPSLRHDTAGIDGDDTESVVDNDEAAGDDDDDHSDDACGDDDTTGRK